MTVQEQALEVLSSLGDVLDAVHNSAKVTNLSHLPTNMLLVWTYFKHDPCSRHRMLSHLPPCAHTGGRDAACELGAAARLAQPRPAAGLRGFGLEALSPAAPGQFVSSIPLFVCFFSLFRGIYLPDFHRAHLCVAGRRAGADKDHLGKLSSARLRRARCWRQPEKLADPRSTGRGSHEYAGTCVSVALAFLFG
jgi:hypothetical protein